MGLYDPCNFSCTAICSFHADKRLGIELDKGFAQSTTYSWAMAIDAAFEGSKPTIFSKIIDLCVLVEDDEMIDPTKSIEKESMMI